MSMSLGVPFAPAVACPDAPAKDERPVRSQRRRSACGRANFSATGCRRAHASARHLERWGADHALRHPLLRFRRRRRRLDQGGGRRRHGAARAPSRTKLAEGPARPGGAAAADHGRHDAAQGRARRWSSTGRSPRPRSSCSASTSSIAPTSTRRSRSPRELAEANPGGAYEIRPGRACFNPAARAAGDVTDLAWIDAALTAARPQAMGALLRYFRDLDTAEEAFQEACLRALKNWPQNGPPRDPAAWLIFVGRNAAHRRGAPARASRSRCRDEEPISDLDDAESAARRAARRRRTTATTSCGCCSSAAIPTCRRRSRSRWRCASSRASRSSRSPAPSWSARAAMEQRITRAKARIARGRRAVRDAGRGRARGAARRRGGHDLPRLQRGLFGQRRRRRRRARRSATRRSGWRACCCGCSRPSRRSWG